jgi:hypothetical protein
MCSARLEEYVDKKKEESVFQKLLIVLSKFHSWYVKRQDVGLQELHAERY